MELFVTIQPCVGYTVIITCICLLTKEGKTKPGQSHNRTVGVR